jgi:hypothetical protein
MNEHLKVLYTTKVDGLKAGGNDINVGVCGIYKTDSGTGKWRYYLVSYSSTKGADTLTSDWHSHNMPASLQNIKSCSKEVQSVEDGRKMCDEFKSKWISGSNNTTEYIRDEKLKEILETN